MNLIELNANGHKITFSKSTLTVDNKEYLYKRITDIKRVSGKSAYVFKYDGGDNWQILPFDPKDEAKVNALCTKIKKLIKDRDAKASKPVAPTPVNTPVSAPVAPETEAVEPAAETTPGNLAQNVPEATEPDVVEAPDEATPSHPVQDVPEATEPDVVEVHSEPDVPEASHVEVPASAELLSDGNIGEDSNLVENPETEVVAEVSDDSKNPEKKRKLRKSLIIFGIVIALFAIAGVVWYFAFGPTSNPTVDTNSNNTQQYNDIDELINDLQD